MGNRGVYERYSKPVPVTVEKDACLRYWVLHRPRVVTRSFAFAVAVWCGGPANQRWRYVAGPERASDARWPGESTEWFDEGGERADGRADGGLGGYWRRADTAVTGRAM